MAKKSEKKSGGGGAVAGVAILCLLLGGGAGFSYGTGFFGKGNDNSSGTNSENIPAAEIITEENSEVTTEIKEESSQEIPINVIDITVSGNVILKHGNEITADDVVSDAKKLGEFTVVNIADDSAIADTMDELREKLDSEGITYKIG